MAVEPYRVSQEEGEGSSDRIEDLYDGTEYKTKDQRAETRTTFYERDIDTHVHDPRQARQLKRALRLHEGERKSNRSTRNHQEDKRRVIGIICSQLDLTTTQKRRVRRIVTEEMKVSTFGPYSIEHVTMATVNLVVREDDRWIAEEERFTDYMVDVGLSNEMPNGEHRADLDTLANLRDMVRERAESIE